jgi:hypothetical protein
MLNASSHFCHPYHAATNEPMKAHMAPISDLPAELLEDILHQLSLPSLSRLSRSCKTFHTFLLPRIYHTIDWTWCDEDDDAPPFLLLLRTLLQNATLRKKVKVLRLRGKGVVEEKEWRVLFDAEGTHTLRPLHLTQGIGDTARIQATMLEDNNLKKIAAVVCGVAIPGHPSNSWMQELKRGNADVFVALLLSRLPALEKLDLGFGYLHRATFLPAMLRHLTFQRREPFYSDLVMVSMAADAPYSPIHFWSHLDFTRPLFFLPNICSIDAVVTEPVVFGWPSPSLTPHLVSLSSLTFRASTLMPKTLGRLLSCTPALKHLVYEHVRSVGWGSPQWADYYLCCPQQLIVETCTRCRDCLEWSPRPIKQELFYCTHLDAALSHVKSTLQSLVLRVRFEPEHYEDIFELSTDHATLCGMIGHLTLPRSMPLLTKLEVPWCMLFGWEADFPERYRNGWRPDEAVSVFPEHGGEESWDFSRFNWPDVLPSSITKLVLRDDLKAFQHYGYTRRATAVLVGRLLDQREKHFLELGCLGFHFEANMDEGPWNRRYREAKDEYEERRTRECMQKTKLLRDACVEGGVQCEIVREGWDVRRRWWGVLEHDIG